MNEIKTTTEQATAQPAGTAPQAQANANANAQDSRAMLPRVDVLEDEAGITLLADLPGVPKDKLTLKVEGDRLLIEGEVAPMTPEALQPLYAEVRVPRYRRAFTLSRELDGGGIEANLKDGVLTLRVPKHQHAQPRRIQVQVG